MFPTAVTAGKMICLSILTWLSCTNTIPLEVFPIGNFAKDDSFAHFPPLLETLEDTKFGGRRAKRLPCGDHPFGVNFTIFEQDCKGQPPFAGVRGVPERLRFLFLLAAAGGERGKGTSGDTPETPAGRPCTPSVDAKGGSPPVFCVRYLYFLVSYDG